MSGGYPWWVPLTHSSHGGKMQAKKGAPKQNAGALGELGWGDIGFVTVQPRLADGLVR
jgi:hypothetical protein